MSPACRRRQIRLPSAKPRPPLIGRRRPTSTCSSSSGEKERADRQGVERLSGGGSQAGGFGRGGVDPNHRSGREAIVDKYGVSRSPMPLVLAIAPCGAITKGFTKTFDEDQLRTAFVSPCTAECMKALKIASWCCCASSIRRRRSSRCRCKRACRTSRRTDSTPGRRRLWSSTPMTDGGSISQGPSG